MGMALNEISRRSLSRRGLLFEACICLPCALTVEPSIIIIVAGCSTLAMRSCFDALMMISSVAIGSTRRRCKCRGSSQALLASWALLPLTRQGCFICPFSDHRPLPSETFESMNRICRNVDGLPSRYDALDAVDRSLNAPFVHRHAFRVLLMPMQRNREKWTVSGADDLGLPVI